MQVSIYLLLRSRSAHQIKIDKAINLQVNKYGERGEGVPRNRAEGCRKVKVYREQKMVKRVSHVALVVVGSLKYIERGPSPPRFASINPPAPTAGHRDSVIKTLTHWAIWASHRNVEHN